MCTWESNPQPLRCKHNALTTEPQEHFLVFLFISNLLIFQMHESHCFSFYLNWSHIPNCKSAKWLNVNVNDIKSLCLYMYHFPNQNPVFSRKAENEKNVSATSDYQWHFLYSITSNKLSFLYAGDEDILFHLPIKSPHYSAPPRSPRSSLCMLSPWTKTSIWSAAVLNEPNPRAPKHQLKCRWNDFPPCASVLSLHNALTPLRWRA